MFLVLLTHNSLFPVIEYPHYNDNDTTAIKMTSTFLGFFNWLRHALLPSHLDPSPPTDFFILDFTRITFDYKASLPDSCDEGRELVNSIVKQYNHLGFGRRGMNELAMFQSSEQHLFRMLRKPFDFYRLSDKVLVIPMSPASTPFQAVQKAIDFVRTHFASYIDR
jgi:hypothetical protein